MSKKLSIDGLFPVLTNEKLSERYSGVYNTTYVGIDFGTSTTVVSIAYMSKGSQPIVVKPIELNMKLEDGSTFSSYKIPSVVAWYKNNIIIGEGAKKLKYKLRQGKNLWHSFKMELGEDVGCKYPNSELGKSHPVITILNPTDVSALFFKYLKAQIDKYVRTNNLPANIQYAVSIPASFEANQRKDLILSIESNGIMINKQSLIDEPNAAFLSYILNSEKNNQQITLQEDYFPNILVFDFGAGTCDISILELGQDNNGIYSKNIAISRFEKLGGDDMDKLIAVDVLLPQLLKSKGLSPEDFRTRELKELIIPKLLPSAERLKIQICEMVSLQSTTKAISEFTTSNEFVSIGKSIEVETSKGLLSLHEPKMSLQEFVKINTVFTRQNDNLPAKRVEKEFEFVSIFNPIRSALKKANLGVDDIDYVLFIGGSSKNPFIQHAVSDYFPNSEKLIPSDLQAHVSTGSALHSMIYNGFGKNIISPITSEPIMIITKDGYIEKVEPIIEAGTVIPSELKLIDNLTPQREGQESIELPICVGSKSKILYNIKLFNPEGNGFRLTDKIKLEFEINADKLLFIRASAAEVCVMVQPISPFSNKEMTTEERIVYKAEREFNLAVEKNGGEPSLEALKQLHKAYESVSYHFKAAETLEQINELFPGKSNLNNIGLHYSNAGKKEKAIKYYELALQQNPSATTAFNLAMQYKYSDKVKYKSYIMKALSINPEDLTSSYSLGMIYRENGEQENGDKLLEIAFGKWKKKFESNKMESWDFSWFASCAKALGKHDYAKHIEESAPEENLNKIYKSENLSQLKQDDGITKF